VSAQLLVILFALATFSIVQRNARLVRQDKAKAVEAAKT
jgi:high-affinity iron transporter